MAFQKGVYNRQHSRKQLLICQEGQLQDMKCRTHFCRPWLRPGGEAYIAHADLRTGEEGACCAHPKPRSRPFGLATSPTIFLCHCSFVF